MIGPIVLIGTSRDDDRLMAVGLYPTVEDANDAVRSGKVPAGYTYSVLIPAMGQTLERLPGMEYLR